MDDRVPVTPGDRHQPDSFSQLAESFSSASKADVRVIEAVRPPRGWWKANVGGLTGKMFVACC